MNDVIRILKADHREVEGLLTKLADTDEGEERNRLVTEVRTKLSLHMELEEELLYPKVAELIGAEDEEEAETEHGLAREGLDKLTELAAKPGFGAAVEMLKAGIKHHVHEEETELLPELKEALDRDAWRAMGDELARRKEAAGAPPAPAPKRRSAKRPAAGASGANGRKK